MSGWEIGAPGLGWGNARVPSYIKWLRTPVFLSPRPFSLPAYVKAVKIHLVSKSGSRSHRHFLPVFHRRPHKVSHPPTHHHPNLIIQPPQQLHPTDHSSSNTPTEDVRSKDKMSSPQAGRTLSTATKRAVALYRHQHQHLLAAAAASAMATPSETLGQSQAQSTKAQGQTEAGSGFISLKTLELLAASPGAAGKLVGN